MQVLAGDRRPGRGHLKSSHGIKRKILASNIEHLLCAVHFTGPLKYRDDLEIESEGRELKLPGGGRAVHKVGKAQRQVDGPPGCGDLC